jgi:hypothetical protein
MSIGKTEGPHSRIVSQGTPPAEQKIAKGLDQLVASHAKKPETATKKLVGRTSLQTQAQARALSVFQRMSFKSSQGS